MNTDERPIRFIRPYPSPGHIFSRISRWQTEQLVNPTSAPKIQPVQPSPTCIFHHARRPCPKTNRRRPTNEPSPGIVLASGYCFSLLELLLPLVPEPLVPELPELLELPAPELPELLVPELERGLLFVLVRVEDEPD
jgi:hypothetical protein